MGRAQGEGGAERAGKCGAGAMARVRDRVTAATIRDTTTTPITGPSHSKIDSLAVVHAVLEIDVIVVMVH